MATLLVALQGCGNGGGDGEPRGSTTASPDGPPSETLTITHHVVTLGHSARLTWRSLNTTDCSASGSWGGARPTNGTEVVQPTARGSYRYTLQCKGPAGSATASVSLVVNPASPLPLSSYVQRKSLEIGPQVNPGAVYEAAYAYGDFFHDGRLALVTHTIVLNRNEDPHGRIRFYQKDSDGNWIEDTAALLSDTVGCILARKAIVTDINQDGRPDVFFACTGSDLPPFPGEPSRYLLSQPDGTYRQEVLPFSGYAHSASADDIDGDGYPDVLVTDTSVAMTPYFLINNADGTLTPDYSRLPGSLKFKAIYTAELIDFSGDGRPDVFFAGNEPNTVTPGNPCTCELLPTVFYGNDSGTYDDTRSTTLPGDSSYGIVLDVIYRNGFLYFLRTVDTQGSNFYNGAEIQKVSYASREATVIYSHTGPYPTGDGGSYKTWIPWITPYNGRIAAEDASFGVSVPE